MGDADGTQRASRCRIGDGGQDVLARICPPSEDARAAERSLAIDRAIAELPPSYRDVIRLRIVHGMSTTDAALAMNRTPGALSVLLCTAVRRLGETLREERQDHR
ncbi:MAG: sigma-70 family RNA polymerase sigma factor [Phycisphaerae bacterium]|nr:sigma-70 family RNA polymerase sigma factor [Phycisphaerae bacterium]